MADGSVKQINTTFLDSGLGASRLCSVINHLSGYTSSLSTYDNEDLSGLVKLAWNFLSNHKPRESMVRVLADHLRCCIVMLFQGITSSNVSSGYVLRKLLRRGFSILLYHVSSDLNVDNLWADAIQEIVATHTLEMFGETQVRFSQVRTKEAVLDCLKQEWQSYVKVWIASEKLLKGVNLYDKEKLDYLRSTHGVPSLLVDKLRSKV